MEIVYILTGILVGGIIGFLISKSKSDIVATRAAMLEGQLNETKLQNEKQLQETKNNMKNNCSRLKSRTKNNYKNSKNRMRNKYPRQRLSTTSSCRR